MLAQYNIPPGRRTQLVGCLKVWVSGTQASSDYAQDVIQDTVYEARMSAATSVNAQYLTVEQTRHKAALCSVLASAPYPEPASRPSSVTREDSFFAQCHKMVMLREQSVQFYHQISNIKSLMLF